MPRRLMSGNWSRSTSRGWSPTCKSATSEVAKFYEENKEACGGATLEQVKDQLKQLVLQQKQQDLVDEHVRTLGQRMSIEVSAAWAKEQAVLAKDNPVDKARSSGKPSLVDFGSTGCRPCDMLAPILETLKAKYAGKANVLFVHVGAGADPGRTVWHPDHSRAVLLRQGRQRGLPPRRLLAAGGDREEAGGDGSQIRHGETVHNFDARRRGHARHRSVAAFVWGILSILLSPCHLSSIPLIVGFIDEQGRMSTKRAFCHFDACSPVGF